MSGRPERLNTRQQVSDAITHHLEYRLPAKRKEPLQTHSDHIQRCGE
jgi:hypothetical protein